MVRYERYEMTFAEIARTIDAQLPGSAYRHQVEGSDRNALGPCGWTRVTFTPGQAGGRGQLESDVGNHAAGSSPSLPGRCAHLR
jgi:hypothetical protein